MQMINRKRIDTAIRRLWVTYAQIYQGGERGFNEEDLIIMRMITKSRAVQSEFEKYKRMKLVPEILEIEDE